MLDARARGIPGEKSWHFTRMNGDGTRIPIAEHSASNITTVKETRKDKIDVFFLLLEPIYVVIFGYEADLTPFTEGLT